MVNAGEEKFICAGIIASAHGVRGEVNIHPYVDDPDFFLSHTLYYNKTGDKQYNIHVKGHKKRLFIATIEGVKDRNMAELLHGTELYISRDLLPPAEEEEFYYEDLVGLKAHDAGGKAFAVVKALYNFGAGDIIELELLESGKLVMFPFTLEVVPEIHVAEGYIVVYPPETIGEEGETSGEAE